VNNPAKVVCFDIEATNLNANFGFILCASFKKLGEDEVTTFSITDSPSFKEDTTDDRWVCEQISEYLSDADIIISWYGTRFDMPYIQSRLLYHKLPIIGPIPHIDGWRIARFKMKLHSNRLQSVTEFLGFEDKTPLNGPIWIKATSGNEDAITYVVKHCEQDVRVLEDVYTTIRPLLIQHPNINLLTGKRNACPTCGSSNLIKRGIRLMSTGKRQRYRCQKCGCWSSSSTKYVEGVEIR